MTDQAKRTRAVYTLLALLAVLLPMTGWFAHSATEKSHYVLLDVSQQAASQRTCGPMYTAYPRESHVRR